MIDLLTYLSGFGSESGDAYTSPSNVFHLLVTRNPSYIVLQL